MLPRQIISGHPGGQTGNADGDGVDLPKCKVMKEQLLYDFIRSHFSERLKTEPHRVR